MRNRCRVAGVLVGLAFLGAANVRAQPPRTVSSDAFALGYSEAGITSLKHVRDQGDTDYIAQGRALGGDVTVRYRDIGGGDWKKASGFKLETDSADGGLRYALADPAEKLKVEQTFKFDGDSLGWSITLTNRSGAALEVGDLAVPMVFEENVPREAGELYERKLLRHSLVAGYGSWIFWHRANAVGPYLVLTPDAATKFEYFDNSAKAFTPYIHATVASQPPMEKARAFGGAARPWRLPLTSLPLAPAASVTYRFKLQFADGGFDGVREVLYKEGLFDTSIVPGMAVPDDLPALISLRTKARIEAIETEFPDQTTIEPLGERGDGNHVFRARFSHLGENLLKVRYDGDKWTTLEFFVTEPLETVIRKRANFLATRQQHDAPGHPWHGAYGDWDQLHHILRNPQDRDGLAPWLVDSSDDAGNARPAFLAAKNVFFPDPAEIKSVERYIRFYLWNGGKPGQGDAHGKGGMQMAEGEKYPYGIYGTFVNWWGHRSPNAKPGRDGVDHLWRIYDYPHIAHLYYRMYQIAQRYPETVEWNDAAGYLALAYRTAKAYWEVPMKIEKWSADSVGTMNEAFLPELIDALQAEGKKEWADDLRAKWEHKVAGFVLQTPNLYGSEFAFDSTGFESTQAFARYALTHARTEGRAPAFKPGDDPRFDQITPADAEKFHAFQMRLNVCDRGWLETTYYQLGSDYRGSMSYLLSYMSQLGGWAIMDEALHFARDPAPYLRLGYASSLSAWSLVNSGTAASGYGAWFPARVNDGATGGGFVPEAWGRGWIGKDMPRGAWYYSAEEDVGYVGALRTHCTVLTDDPLFGPVALGGLLKQVGDVAEVTPRDGLRVRFHVVRGEQRLHLVLDRDGFAREQPITVNTGLERLAFTVENRGGPAHDTPLNVAGLPPGDYRVLAEGREIARVPGGPGEHVVPLPLGSHPSLPVRIEAVR